MRRFFWNDWYNSTVNTKPEWKLKQCRVFVGAESIVKSRGGGLPYSACKWRKSTKWIINPFSWLWWRSLFTGTRCSLMYVYNVYKKNCLKVRCRCYTPKCPITKEQIFWKKNVLAFLSWSVNHRVMLLNWEQCSELRVQLYSLILHKFALLWEKNKQEMHETHKRGP